MKSQSSLYFNMAWRLSLDVLSRGLFFIVNVFIARRFGVSEFGKFAYAVALAQIFYAFTEMGTTVQLCKELGEQKSDPQTTWKNFFELKLLLIAASFLFFSPLSVMLWRWENAWIPVAAMMWMFANSMLDFHQYACNGMGKLNLAQKMIFFQRGFMFVGVIVPLLIWNTLESVVAGVAVGSVFGVFLSTIYFFRKAGMEGKWRGDRSEWKRILFNSSPVGFASLLGQSWVRIGAFLLGLQWSSRIVGEYSAAFRVFETIYIFPSAIMAISVSHLSGALRSGREAFVSQLKGILSVFIPLAIASIIVLCLLAPWIVRFLFGPAYTASVPVLRIFGVVSGFVFLNYLATNLLVIAGRQKRHALNVVITFMASLCFFLFLIERTAAGGAAVALLLTELTLFSLTAASLLKWWRRPPV